MKNLPEGRNGINKVRDRHIGGRGETTMEQPGQSSQGYSRAWREIFGTQKEIEFSLLKDGGRFKHSPGLPSEVY